MLYFDLLTDDIIIKILEINTYYIEKELYSIYLILNDVETILSYSSSDENYDYDYDSDLDNMYGM